MTTTETILAIIAGAGFLVGALGTFRQARSTGKKTVTDIYGEALDRVDKRLTEAEQKIDRLEAQLVRERAHSATQDAKLSSLRRAVLAWSAWGERIQRDWPSIRQSPQPPPLPIYDTND